MVIEVKHYKNREKQERKERPPAPYKDRPKVRKSGKKYVYKTKEGPTAGPFNTWGEAECSRRAYWENVK